MNETNAPQIELTFAIIKPGAVAAKHSGDIIKQTEAHGFEVLALQKGLLTKQQAEVFYDIHKDRPFFGELVESMTSGPITVMVLARPNAVAAWRDLMGATNPAEAAEGTLRKQFGKNIGENATHGSDSIQNALREISLFFPDMLTNPEKAS